MRPVKPLDILVTGSLKGREAPPDVPSRRTANNTMTIETPGLPFETEPLKIRRPTPPRRVQTSYTKVRPRTQAKEEHQYAIRFPDYTWGHTDPENRDHYANRQEIEEVANNFDKVLRSISESDEVETASTLQAAADLLLDNIESQLRSECREQSELVTRARVSYAHVFSLMELDAQKARALIDKLERGNEKLEENLTKIIDNATERVKEAQEECARQIASITKEMEEKKEEYDTSMKRFLEQKTQLEEHVKALHRVFLDFQNDSVYITLEDLKQKQESLEKKVRNKDREIAKLQGNIQTHLKQIQEEADQKLMLEQTCDELRRKLKSAMATINRLQRRLDMQNIDQMPMIGIFGSDDDGEDGNMKLGDELGPPLVQSQHIMTSQNSSPNKRGGRRGDLSPLLNLHQKLSRIGDKMVDALQRTNNTSVFMNDSLNDDLDKLMLSCDSRLMMRALEAKIDDLTRVSEYLDSIDGSGTGANGFIFGGMPGTSTANLMANIPRFLRFINEHNKPGEKESAPSQTDPKAFQIIRQIMQSKYMSDQWRQRMGRPPMRFPEFVISFHCKDRENMFTALQRSVRMWNFIEDQKIPELKLFKKFLLEKYTVDELSFFLELRCALIGLPPVTSEEAPIIKVSIRKCKEVVCKVLGSFSPVTATVLTEAAQFVQDEFIDYAQFAKILIDYYQNERRKRRNAVRLMFQSKRFAGADGKVDFENFHAMVQSLGFPGSLDDIFDLHRESVLLGGGELSIDSILRAMDNLSFHFYSIELPARLTKKTDLVALTRPELLSHWQTFGMWFEAFRKPRENFDTWVKSRLVQKVNDIDKLFKSNAPIPNLFSEYRSLLDYFQFTLDAMAKGKNRVMSTHKAEKELTILENLIDLLITFVIDIPEDGIEFSEFD
ncbi:hypothetical protein TRFO_09009 [Tritrichomonas foetus]|uniref:Uncharacterized protein n=1 Tax=Tritrichomonas foetus TaxID=1144522 RepID=A0A1J4JHG0_9EUKA|nr:hypothetical protein TRFO_09009 [Tritrichomonas foetus]|eukprot:OHS98161.1 hypothetical protein TRFO_09009 [Tritrichomonas foetus]